MKQADTAQTPNVDAREIRKFDGLASRWWDPAGEFKPLHRLNPLRMAFINERTKLEQSRCIDVGCGGGLLTEALAGHAASVTGIDMSGQALAVARIHQQKTGLRNIDYKQCVPADMLPEYAGQFDTVTCMEVLEHVPDPAALVADCGALVRPGGNVFFGTLNRNPRSFLLAIVGAEYLLGLLPRGTHSYDKFIRPSELRRWAHEAGLYCSDVAGMHYNPATENVRLSGNVDVNYLMHCTRPA